MADAFDESGTMADEKACRDLIKGLADKALFVSVAIVGIKEDGSTGTMYYVGPNIWTLLGGIEHLRHRMLEESVESTTQSLDDEDD